MLDIKYIKENTDDVINRLAAKGKDAREEIAEILTLDAKRREIIARNDALKAEKNQVSKAIPQYKKEGKDVSAIFADMKKLGARSKEIDVELKEVDAQLQGVLLGLPNLPDRDLKAGGKENNEPIRYFRSEERRVGKEC